MWNDLIRIHTSFSQSEYRPPFYRNPTVLTREELEEGGAGGRLDRHVLLLAAKSRRYCSEYGNKVSNRSVVLHPLPYPSMMSARSFAGSNL